MKVVPLLPAFSPLLLPPLCPPSFPRPQEHTRGRQQQLLQEKQIEGLPWLGVVRKRFQRSEGLN